MNIIWLQALEEVLPPTWAPRRKRHARRRIVGTKRIPSGDSSSDDSVSLLPRSAASAKPIAVPGTPFAEGRAAASMLPAGHGRPPANATAALRRPGAASKPTTKSAPSAGSAPLPVTAAAAAASTEEDSDAVLFELCSKF